MPLKLTSKQCKRCNQVLPRSAFGQISRTDSPSFRLDPLCLECREIRTAELTISPNTTVHCACGCDKLTNVAIRTNETFGWIKGEPMRFLKGHNTRHSPYPEELYTVDPETGCWNWNLQRDKDGYGMFNRGGKRHRAHRYFFEQRFGPLPNGMVPDHVCPFGPNTSCVNPDHMAARTLEENSRWKSTTKLNWEDVAEIRFLALQGKTHATIASQFGISRGHIQSIVAGTRWRKKAA